MLIKMMTTGVILPWLATMCVFMFICWLAKPASND